MIMRWRKTDKGDFKADWNGTQFLLTEDPTTRLWHLLADDKHMHNTWRRSSAAMSDIDFRQQYILRQGILAAKLSQGDLHASTSA